MNQREWEEREEMYACWLCNFPGIRNNQMHRLSEICGGPEKIYFASQDTWGQVLEPKQVEGLKKYTAEWRPEQQYGKMKEQGIDLILFSGKEYPQRLKDIPDAPYALFVRGKLPEEEIPAVAVIGARECSEYGNYVARQLGAALGKYGVTVISGMAKGIDGISQRAALEAGGGSVGVLGSGVDVCYPAQNRELYERLLEKGAVISSYPIGTPAYSWNFPPRNRIVSGLADAVVVIEARVKSGTLITVDMALEQGREVYVVPGRVTDRLSDGCNRLIRQGAGLLLNPEEFVAELLELGERKKGYAAAERERPHGGYLKNDKGTTTEAQGTSMKDEVQGALMQVENQSTNQHTERKCLHPKRKNVAMGMERKDLTSDLSPELADVYKTLDFSPKSVEEIHQALSGKYQEKQVITCLMRLSMENLAVQVSPGQFCCRGE